MAFCELRWFSHVLSKQTTTWVLLPDGLKPPYHSFYLLHGLSDDHSMWLRRTRVEMYVEGKPLIVVMPDGGRGFYTDHEKGPKWAQHIGVELPAMIEKTFPAKPDRAARHIGGLSMGGYGAMRLGLGFCDRFSSITSHSGALLFGNHPEKEPERILMVGEQPEGSNHDLLVLVKRAKKKAQLPRIRIDCGFDDFLLESNRSVHRSLTKLKVPHEYEEFPGDHNWDYWDLHIRQAIDFHLPPTNRAR